MISSATADTRPLVVALAGNPNTGKTTLFNRLTGARQKAGNYPGVTVEKKTGTARVGGRDAVVIDLPGAYSLAASTPDEHVVIEALSGRMPGTPRPDVVVCIAEAANLRRNLFLASQIAETGLPVVIALNMMDEAETRGLRIDVKRLAERLGVPVVPTVALTGAGREGLLDAVADAVGRRPVLAPPPWPDALRAAARGLREDLAGRVTPPLTEAESFRLVLDAESADLPPVGLSAADLRAPAERARAALRAAGLDPVRLEADVRYRHIDALLDGAVVRGAPAGEARQYLPDRILTHRVAGMIVFTLLMLLVFSSIYWFAAPLMDGIDAVTGRLGDLAGTALAGTPMLRSLVVDGVIAGVGGVVIFLPQILILFFFIAVLEDTGYMARAAFLMDRVFSWTGLNGKSFVPMLSSFACAVPAIMGARTIENPKARRLTVLVSPLISCSARLPVYVLMIGAFIEPRYGPIVAGAALFAMHVLGLAVAVPAAWLINRFVLRIKGIPFILEMPPYRRPLLRDVLWRMYRSGREFAVNAGTVIFAISIVIWALTYFPRPPEVRASVAAAVAAEKGVPAAAADALLDGELAPRLEGAYTEQSWLGRFGRTVQPAFAPAGFDWKITVGVLASFPAREVIVSTLGIIYELSEEDLEAGGESSALRDRLAAARWADGRPVFTPATAVAVMVFFALCMQCGSTMAVMAREIGWRWTWAAFGVMTVLAWSGAVAAYQAGTALLG